MKKVMRTNGLPKKPESQEGKEDRIAIEIRKQRASLNGSPEFYRLLDTMADLHNRKSHDYANNNSPFANYLFAGKFSQIFKNPDDAGFVGRIGEKLFRLANLENDGKSPLNESVEDTELDICVITALWMACRRERRAKAATMLLGDWIADGREADRHNRKAGKTGKQQSKRERG